MRLRIVSDLHCELHADSGRELLDKVASGEFDVLVIAGDLTSSRVLHKSVTILATSTDRPIVYVTGNHEFYGSNRTTVMGELKRLETQYPNVHVLDHEISEIDGVRFLGTSLWFRKSSAPTWAMSDFTAIDRFADWVYTENGRAREFLEEELAPLDVVVTHYLPHPRSIHPRYTNNPLNPFFLCDMSSLIQQRRPALWIHGHTHESMHYRLGDTRVVCNPFGYAGHEINPKFDPHLTIDLETP